ncbi:MAG: (d)CMP kinase [Methylacidiphilales bacterium]|nr:(d)CMP kinase [Candidatus Methylacidiphilales bacterium]
MSHPVHPVIAIDGTAASGKSTFSRRLSQKLGYAYVNTGAMYRGVTWYLQQRNVPLGEPEAVTRGLAGATLETRLENGELAFRISGVDPLPHVREGKVNDEVSLVARVAAVRKLLVAEQQRLAQLAPLVMEGRDIGTVVFPQTPYKFFLDADAVVRAQRRQNQGETDAILQRDVLDQQRENSPLTCASDALRLDSSLSTVDELIALALRHLASLGLKSQSHFS